MKKLNIFVSSTCYDLSQIRVNLREHIENIGHNAMLSEFINFPINPSKKTVENCINAVKNDADFFILIVGNRYGSIIDSGRSITNTEFLTAKNKGIPVYIFIDKKILNILPVWQKNKEGDFSEIVDTPKIFEFITELRNDSKLWTFEFENAQDIISILKTQMSYLFRESLEIFTKYNKETIDLFKNNLSNEALNILLKKEENFEIDFFIQTLSDEIKKKEILKNDYSYRIIMQPKYAIHDNEELFKWLKERLSIISNLIESLNKLFHDAFPIFYAKPGVSSDLKGLYYISETYARIYENILNWTIDTYSTSVDEESIELKNKLANLSSNVLNQVWDFPFNQKKEFEKVKERSMSGETGIKLTSTLTITINELALHEYTNEFDSFKTRFLLKK